MNNSIIEINKKQSKAGRTPIKLILHTLHKDETEYNKNGISWIKEYCEQNIESIKGMQLVTQFLDDKHEIPFGDHGNMRVVEENKVIFEDSLVIGSFTKGYIAEGIEVNGKTIDAVVGEGYIYNQRFPKLIDYLQEQYDNGNSVEGSVEICADESKGNSQIIYDGGWKTKGRKPEVFQYSGHALVIGTTPADDDALMIELNSYKKKEDNNMKNTVIELNKISFDDIATLVTRAVNTAMGESCYGDYYIYKFYPLDSQVVFRKWDGVGIYYMTTYKVENSTVTISEIIKVEEDWKPVSNPEPVEINAKRIREIIKGGNTMEELIREKDKKIEELNSKITEINSQNTTLTTKVTELEGKISEINSTLVEVNKLLEDTKAEKENLSTEVNALKEYKETKEVEAKKSEVNAYFENEIPKNKFAEAEVNSLKEYVEKCDLEGLKKAESDLIIKKFKELVKDGVGTETNSVNNNLFISTKDEKMDAVEAGKLLFK
jgi:hypothetical protein